MPSVEDIFVTNYYQLPNNQTLNSFNDGQLVIKFNEEETLVFNSGFPNIVQISEDCKIGLFLKQMASRFLCQDIVKEGRIVMETNDYAFSKAITICTEIKIFFQGVLIDKNVSYLCFKLIDYK